MTLPPSTAAAIALAGSFVLSLGMALQKRHVGWIGSTPRRRSGKAPGVERRGKMRFYKDLGFWFLGFTLVNASSASQFFAVMGLPTNVVGLSAGASVAFTAILAKLLLKERLGKGRLAWTIVLFAAIAAAGLLGEGGSSSSGELSQTALFVFLGIPAAAGLILLFAGRRFFKGPRLAATFAAISGSLGGFIVFPFRALQVTAKPDLAGWISSPYLYAWLAAGFSSFILVQAAYKDGEMAAVAPSLYGMQVLWPALASYFVFGSKFLPLQTIAFVVVAISVIMIAGVHPVARRPVALIGDDRERR